MLNLLLIKEAKTCKASHISKLKII